MKLSVVISTYNRWQLLELCILSLYQTRAEQRDWECIVVDDGSTDDTLAWLARWRQERGIRGITNFRHVRRLLNVGKPNCPGLARNCGLREARGEFVAFMDGDCFFVTDAVKQTLEWCEDSDHAMLTSGCWYRVTKTSGGDWYEEGPRGEKQSVPFGPWFAVETEMLKRIGGFDERFTTYGGEDHDLLGRLVSMGIRMDRDSQIIAHHLWHVPGARDRVEGQYKKQLEIIAQDVTVERNIGLEWGRLT